MKEQPFCNLETRGRFHKLFCALRPTFEKLFRGVGRTLHRAPNFNRAIFMIYALRPTFMKSTPGSTKMWLFEGEERPSICACRRRSRNMSQNKSAKILKYGIAKIDNIIMCNTPLSDVSPTIIRHHTRGEAFYLRIMPLWKKVFLYSGVHFIKVKRQFWLLQCQNLGV